MRKATWIDRLTWIFITFGALYLGGHLIWAFLHRALGCWWMDI